MCICEGGARAAERRRTHGTPVLEMAAFQKNILMFERKLNVAVAKAQSVAKNDSSH